MSENKVFDEWEKADCNDCARYWDNSCDGVPKGSQKPCNSFLATRTVVIPYRLKALEKSVKWLTVGSMFTSIALILHLLTHLF